MENQRERAFALLAGNGALLLFWSQYTLDTVNTLARNDLRFALVLLPMAGLAGGYFALTHSRDDRVTYSFKWGEAIALYAFGIASLYPLLSIAEQLGWSIPFLGYVTRTPSG